MSRLIYLHIHQFRAMVWGGAYNLLNSVFNIWATLRVWMGRNSLKNKGIRIMCPKCPSVM